MRAAATRWIKSRPMLSAILVIEVAACLIEATPTQALGSDLWREATKRAMGTIVPWPKEIEFTHGIDYLSISPLKFEIELSKEAKGCAVIDEAISRYLSRFLFDDRKPNPRDDPDTNKRVHLGQLTSLQVRSRSDQNVTCDSEPPVDMDESYELRVVAGEEPVAVLEADSNWGVLRGLESFSQLIFEYDFQVAKWLEPETFGIRPVLIKDSPRFKHRGYMLDTSRHFVTKETILRLLEAMAINKLNVFHWHISDDQSFSFKFKDTKIKSVAYQSSYTYDSNTILGLRWFAARRGIRMIVEVDTPGHSYSLRAVDGLLTECYEPKTRRPNGDLGPIDPTNETAFTNLQYIIKNVASAFDGSQFHAGGDEVDFECWKSNERITRWMSKMNMTGDYEALSNYYMRRLHKFVTKTLNSTMIVWQEVFDMGANLPKDTIVQVWKNINDPPGFMAEMHRVVKAGYRALLSSCWYLNYHEYGQDWPKFYHCDPAAGLSNDQEEESVLGGEICMWTEFVDDTNVLSRTWPRASPAAERLWSPKDKTDTGEFSHRLEQLRCRLIARGIPAEPVNGPGYC